MANQPKNYRKFLAGSVTAALVASAVAPTASAAAGFSDVGNDAHTKNIEKAVEMGLIGGYSDGTFKPYNNISRGQVAKIISRYLEKMGEEVDTTGVAQFEDVVGSGDKDLPEAALQVKAKGIMVGSKGMLKPADPISREEMATVLVRLFDHLVDLEDKESAVTDIEAAFPVHQENINVLSEWGITDQEVFNPKGDVLRAQFVTFMVRAIESMDDVTPEPEMDIEVASVSAINSTAYTFGVTFADEVTAEDLTGQTLTLTNGNVSVVADFTELNGQTALFTVKSTDRSKLVNGEYTVSGTNLTVPAGVKTTFNGIVSKTNVEGIVVDEYGHAVSNATVMAAGHEVKTDSNGYYKLPVNAGLVDVKFTKDERYFVNREQTTVTRNYSTVQNASLIKIDETKLEVLGTAVDTKTGAAVAGAHVELQKKVNGSWVVVGTDTTDATGKYDFGNSYAETAAHNTGNAIDLESEFQVVYSKDLSSSNLDNVYESKTVAVSLSDESHTTNMLTELRPVKELKEMKVDVSWADLAGTDNDADFTTTDLSFELLDSKGRTSLVTASADKTYKASGDKELANAIDLVSEDFFGAGVKPTIPTGTYFLKVNDGTNAIAVLPVKVSEGVNYAGEVTVQKARTLNVTGNYAEVMYSQSLENRSDDVLETIDNDAAETGDQVLADILVTQKIEGVDVVIGSVSDETFNYNSADSSITSNEAVTQLATGTYALSFESDYVLNGKATKSTTISTDVKNETLSFNTASTVELTVNDGTNPIASKAVTVELLNAAGTSVVETYNLRTDASGVVTLPGVKPSEYKVRVSASGYKTETGDKFKVLDIQDRAETISLEEIPAPELSGYVKFANDFSNVDAATVMVYNQDGEEVTYYDVTAGMYDFSNEELEAGKSYTFVVRGTGLETAVATRTIVDGENDPLNFKVVRGGQGMAKFSITDEAFKPLNGGDLTITDSYYSVDTIGGFTGEDAAGSKVGPDFTGEYDATVSGTDAKAWATATELSAGDYELLIESTDTIAHSSVFTIKDINSTYYEAITVKNPTSSITHQISGTVTGAGLDASDVDYVVAFDSNGKIVAWDSASDFDNGDMYNIEVAANETYTVAVFANGHYAASKVVTVQDFDVTADFSVDVANR